MLTSQDKIKRKGLKVFNPIWINNQSSILPEVERLEIIINKFKPKVTRPFKRKNEFWVKLIDENEGEFIMKFKSPLEAEDAIYGLLDLQVYGGKVKLSVKEGNVIEKIEILELYKPSAKELVEEYFTD